VYQYYPNKQSLLFAVLEHPLNTVAARFETACDSACHKPLFINRQWLCKPGILTSSYPHIW
jgi:AcrR family transcriptional regulator